MKVGVWLRLHERAAEYGDALLPHSLFTQPQIHPDILEALKFVVSNPPRLSYFTRCQPFPPQPIISRHRRVSGGVVEMEKNKKILISVLNSPEMSCRSKTPLLRFGKGTRRACWNYFYSCKRLYVVQCKQVPFSI